MVTTSYQMGTKEAEPVNRVTVVIPTKDKLNLLKNAIFSLRKHGGEQFDLIVVDGGSDETWEWLREERIFGIKAEEDWSFSRINNEAVKFVKTEFVLMLNNDTVAKKNCLVEMLKLMSDEKVGVVGAKLLFPDNKIQHIGVFVDNFGVPYHPYHSVQDSPNITLANRDDEFDAVTGACLLTRKELWDKVGGLDEQFCFNYEDVDYCFKVKEAGYKVIVAHRAVFIHLEGMSLDHRVEKKYGYKENLNKLKNKWMVDKRIEKIINRRINLDSGPLSLNKLNIALVPGNKDSGIAYWRIMKPGAMLKKKRLANVEFVYSGIPTDKMMYVLGNADVATYQSYANKSVLNISLLKDERAFKMIYEYDDHPVYLSPWAQVYQKLGTQEVKIQRDGEKVWLWRDGQDGFYLEENVQNVTRLLMIVQNVDYVTTTTPALKEYFETKNANVSAIPNCIDFDVFKPLNMVKDNTVRIAWHGGDNHYHDVCEIGEYLTEFINKTDNVKLVIFGAFYPGPFKGIDMNKVEIHDWVHVEAFPYKLAGLNMDIGIIPLADENKYPFNKYKSDLKFCEYAAFSVPSLVQHPRTAYKDCVDSENALTFENSDEFKEKLERLVSDADFRRNLGKKAYDWCYEHRNLEKSIELWLDVYERVAGVKNGDSRSGLRTSTATTDVQRTEGRNSKGGGGTG